MKYVRRLAANRGTILFVGTKRQARDIIAEEAKRAGMPYVDQRWLGGMLTNFKTVKASIKRLKDMEATIADGGQERMSKKEALTFSREMEKLQKSIGGIKDMNGVPDAIFVIDVGYHKGAVTEATKLGMPVDRRGRHEPLAGRHRVRDPRQRRLAARRSACTRAAWPTRSSKAATTRSTTSSSSRRTARNSSRSRPEPDGATARRDGGVDDGAPFLASDPTAARTERSARRTTWRKSPRAWSRRCARRPTRR